MKTSPRSGIKTKKIKYVLEFNQLQWLKQYILNSTHTKRIEARSNEGKDVKALYRLINNAVYDKTMENLRNRIDVNQVNYRKDFKMYIKTKLYVTQNIWL